jgi:Fic family protein
MAQPRTVLSTLLHEKKRKISGGFYHRIQVDFAYNSNHIEGSRLTHDQTRYIFETHTVDGVAHVDDIIETANHFKCFDYILDTIHEPITEEYIKYLHKLLKNGLPVDDDEDDIVIGDYKKYPNEVGSIQTVHPKDVPSHMAELVHDFENKQDIDLYDVAEFHARFEKIHPFYDGNGRVGRLLALKMCIANGIVPFFINDQSKMFYYMGLKEWQIDGKQSRLLDVFLSMQDDMKTILDYFEIEYDKSETTARELIQKHNA